ncbi:MAG TPA: ABC transporter substrate-binding protein [Thermoanaerobaculia bacterium]|nr:ABC transporter substrate-binding protein [Thermoanaerobaculia bacterium]
MKGIKKSVIALSLLAAFCGPHEQGSNGAASTAQSTIRVGLYGAFTGSTATFGQNTKRGVELAISEINGAGGVLGRKLELFSEDDQGKPEEAASAVTKLITQNNVIGVIGENASSRSLAAAPICQSRHIPMISPSSTNPDVTMKGDYIFRVCFIDSYQGRAVARFARDTLKLSRVAILRDVKNDYSVGLAKFFGDAFIATGGRIVGDLSYVEGDNDFRSQLTAIKTMSPEAIFVPGYYTEVGQIAIQARDLGITAPLLGGDGWDSPKLLEIGGRSLDGAYFANHYFPDEPRPAVQNFVTKYRALYHQAPESVAALGYDAVGILAQAIRAAGSLDSAKIRDAIAQTKDFQGVAGVTTMGPDRNPIKPVALLHVSGGKIAFKEWVKP